MKSEKPRVLIVHPYLLAIYPILYVFSQNRGEVSPPYLIVPVAVVLGAVVLLQLVLGRVVQDRLKSAVITSIACVSFLSYGFIQRAIRAELPWCLVACRHRTFLPLYVAVVAAIIIVVARARSTPVVPTRFLNLLGGILVGFCLAGYVSYELGESGDIRAAAKWARFVQARCAAEPTLRPEYGGPPRDVYYIILDEYGRADDMKRTFGYDNSSFIRYLTKKGFYVAEKSASNYLATYPSLSSSLNMDYLDSIAKQEGLKTIDFHASLGCMIRDSTVSRLFRRAGYKYVSISSGWQLTDRIRADVFKRAGGLNEFERLLVDYSMLGVYQAPILNSYRKHTDYQFEQIPEIGRMKQPTFAFVHIVCPHRPFVYDADGKLPADTWPPPGVSEAAHYRAHYTAQVQYVNKKVCEMVDKLLTNSTVTPIIILQGDHGFQPDADPKYTATKSGRRSGCKLRSAILNAYYLPDGGNKLLYPSISPVNSFRVVFNRYFGANYDLLEDRTYDVRLSRSNMVTEFKRVDD